MTFSKSLLFGLGSVVALGACDLLDVENPNSLVQADLENVTAAGAAVNGAEGTVARGVASIYAGFSTIGDEIYWIGSRDAWQELNQGTPNNPANEFVDGSFPAMAQGRWMAEEAVKLTSGHLAEAEGDERDDLQGQLARASYYAGVAYSVIAQIFDDYAFSDRREAAMPVGPAGMSGVFDTAIGHFTAAITNAQAQGDSDLVAAATAMRAQAYHQKAIWGMLNPAGSTPANPLVSDANANADAAAVLGMVADGWVETFQYSSSTYTNYLAGQVNSREELQIGQDYVTVLADDNTTIDAFIYMDVIDAATIDPRLKAAIDAFLDPANGQSNADVRLTSAVEMRLILAESALSSGGEADAEFLAQINAVRGMDGLTDYSGQVTGMEMLKHERRANLFLMLKRLQDHYRFGEPAMNWLPGSVALTTPGTMLPITVIEIRANPFIN